MKSILSYASVCIAILPILFLSYVAKLLPNNCEISVLTTNLFTKFYANFMPATDIRDVDGGMILLKSIMQVFLYQISILALLISISSRKRLREIVLYASIIPCWIAPLGWGQQLILFPYRSFIISWSIFIFLIFMVPAKFPELKNIFNDVRLCSLLSKSIRACCMLITKCSAIVTLCGALVYYVYGNKEILKKGICAFMVSSYCSLLIKDASEMYLYGILSELKGIKQKQGVPYRNNFLHSLFLKAGTKKSRRALDWFALYLDVIRLVLIFRFIIHVLTYQLTIRTIGNIAKEGVEIL